MVIGSVCGRLKRRQLPVEALDAGAEFCGERHRRASLLHPLRLTADGIQCRAICCKGLIGTAGALQNRAAASEPAVFPRRSSCDAVQSRQRGVVPIQPQLEIDGFELQRDDRAEATDPFVQTLHGLFERRLTAFRLHACTLDVDVGLRPNGERTREVRGSRLAPAKPGVEHGRE